MPIPSQSEYILPFLQVLGDGKKYQRRDIMATLNERFRITPDEARQVKGLYSIVENRIAWYDVYFVSSGFVRKTLHPSDNMQDVFQITALGMEELRTNPHKITIAYLRRFARM